MRYTVEDQKERKKIMKFAQNVKKFKTNNLVVEYDEVFNSFILIVLKDGSEDLNDGYLKRFIIKEVSEVEKDREKLRDLEGEKPKRKAKKKKVKKKKRK